MSEIPLTDGLSRIPRSPGQADSRPVPNGPIWLLPMRRRAAAGIPSHHQNDWDVFPQSTQILTGAFGRQFERIAAERRYRHLVGYIIDNPIEAEGAVRLQAEPASRNRYGEGVNP